MRKIIVGIIGLSLLLVACNESSSSTKNTIDSTVDKLDSAAEKIGEKAEEGWDSVKTKAKDVKDGLDKTFDKKDDK